MEAVARRMDGSDERRPALFLNLSNENERILPEPVLVGRWSRRMDPDSRLMLRPRLHIMRAQDKKLVVEVTTLGTGSEDVGERWGEGAMENGKGQSG